MSKFGWSYPPGAAGDPYAPYNQTADDEHCPACGIAVETDDHEGYCTKACEEMRGTLTCVRPMFELLNAELGREDVDGWKKSIYKGTACGAWLEVVDHQTMRIGSIVEGTDACAEPETLVWPFTSEDLWDAVQDIEDQCDEIWLETHGCDECESLYQSQGFDYWDGQVHPDCPECEGHGVVI